VAADVKIGFVMPLLRAAKATLDAGLADQLAAFNAESENTVDLDDPVKIIIGADDPLGVDGFPVVELAATQGAGGGASVGLGEAGSEFDSFPVLTVVVWNEGDQGELPPTYERSLGMARCVLECLLPAGALGGDASPVVDENGRLAMFWRTDAIPADPTDDGREFRKWRVPCLVQLTCQQIDHFTAA
jgi:hypothetical protein